MKNPPFFNGGFCWFQRFFGYGAPGNNRQLPAKGVPN
jgi:hypothetical protein